MTGYSSKELLQRNMMDWFKDDYESQNNIDSALNAMALKGYGDAEANLQKKNGSRLPVYFTFSALKINDSQYFTGIGMDITRLKKAEEKIKESYTVLRIAGEKAKLGGWSADLSNNKVYWSDEVAILHEMPLGYSPSVEEVINFYAPEWREKITKVFTDCALYGIPYDEEMEIITASGKRIWIETIAESVKDEAGNIIKIQGAFQDISERKQVNKLLQQERELYFDLVNNQPAGIYRIRVLPMNKWEKDAWTNSKKSPYIMELASDRFCEILGITRQDFEENPFIIDDLVYPQDKSDFKLRNVEANAKLIPFRWEGRMLIQDKICWVHLESIPRPVENGEILWTGILYDITESKQTELALKESDERFQLLFNQAPLGYQSLDIDGNFLEVNQQWLEMLGYKREEVIGKWFGDFLTPMYQDGFRQRFPVFKAQGHIHSEFEMLHKNGSILFIAFEGRIGKDLKGNFKQTHCILQDITERKKAENALQISEEKFKKAFMTSPDSININRLEDGMYMSINNGFTRITGYTEEDILGKTSIEKNIWVDFADRDKLVKGLKEKGLVENLVAQFSTKSGGTVYGMMSASIIELDGVKHILNITRDITEIRETELALQKSKATLDTALASTTDAIFITDSEGNYIQFNDAFVKFLHFRNRNELPKNFNQFSNIIDVFNSNDEMVPPETWAVARALRGEIVNNFEYKLRRKDTGETWIGSYSFSPMRDDKGEIIGSVVVARDVTELKQAEKALSESEEKLRTLFASMTEMVAMHELVFNEVGEAINYRIIDCNDAFSLNIGIKKENIVAKLANEVYQLDKAPFLETYTRVAITGESFEHNIFYPPLDKYLLISAVSTGKNRFSTIITDITAMEQVKEIILNKNKELENYIYAASHDLRSPLVNIQGFSQRLQKQTEEIKLALAANGQREIKHDDLDILTSESIPKTLNFILSNVTKMDALINGLLQISRTGRIVMAIKKVNMNDLFNTIIQHDSFEITEIDATVSIDDLPDCYGDENQLNRLFANIIGNALKYRDSNRKLQINVSAQTHFNKVIYCIVDNGIGIAARNIEKIWNVFYRVDSTVSEAGDGIGLSLVKRIADKHKGKVWAESEEGKGSRFYVELQKNEFEE